MIYTLNNYVVESVKNNISFQPLFLPKKFPGYPHAVIPSFPLEMRYQMLPKAIYLMMHLLFLWNLFFIETCQLF